MNKHIKEVLKYFLLGLTIVPTFFFLMAAYLPYLGVIDPIITSEDIDIALKSGTIITDNAHVEAMKLKGALVSVTETGLIIGIFAAIIKASDIFFLSRKNKLNQIKETLVD